MDAVFLKLVNISITAGWLILAVIGLRPVLKRAPRAVHCILWGLVGVRLVFPFSIESVLSLIPSAQTVPYEILYAREPAINSGVEIINSVVNPVISSSLAPQGFGSVNPLQVWTSIAANVWILGIAAMLLYTAVSYLRLRRTVAPALRLRENIWVCDYIDTPFILGILRPRIYLPSSLDGKALTHVLAHERAHLARRDHWWKPLGFLILSVYWFNPLIWVAYILLCRDIELACDERVIQTLGEQEKKSYSQALLHCSVPRRLIAACPLAFGEVGVKQRIKSILNYKKPAFWAIAAAAAACVIAAVCFLTDPVTASGEDSPTLSAATDIPEYNRVIEDGYLRVAIALPEDWECEVIDDRDKFGLSFHPAGVSGSIQLFHSDSFAVCGTDLESEPVTFFDGTTGYLCTYTGDPLWHHILYSDAPGSYFATTHNADDWWAEYADEAMQILDTAALGQGAISKQEAIRIAQEAYNQDETARITQKAFGPFDRTTIMAIFDVETGYWTVDFYEHIYDSSPRQMYLVSATGELTDADGWGLGLSAADVSATGMTLYCTQAGWRFGGTLITGRYYWLERQTPNGWRIVPEINEAFFTTEGLGISQNSKTQWGINWSQRYGELQPGTYRIGKSFTERSGLGELEDRAYYAEFVVE